MSYVRLNCRRTPLYNAAVGALDRLGEAEGAQAVTDAYAESVGPLMEKEYQRDHGLTPSRGQVCVQRLLGKRCRAFDGTEYECQCDIPHADHQTLWLKDGNPEVYVSQNYPLGQEQLREMLAFCDRHGLRLEIRADAAWHYPGNVVTVRVSRKSP